MGGVLTRAALRAALAGALALACGGASAQGGPGALPPLLLDAPEPILRAQVSPRRETVLSAEIAGKVTAFAVREGERFAQGDVLVAIDCAAHEARRDRARAQETAARRKVEIAGRLETLSSISRLEVDDAAAALAAASAETALAEVFVARCAVRAPFAGRVAETFARAHQFVGEGERLLAILDDGELEVELIAPSRWLSWLVPGLPFTVRVDELDRDVVARVARIGARVDPVSQSVKIFGTIEAGAEGLVAGMSGAARIVPPADAGVGGSARAPGG